MNGKIAVGTVPDGDRLGGALVIYDPKTNTAQKFRNVVQDESVFGLTARCGIVYGGTSIVGGLATTPPTRDAGTVFAWDVQASRKLWETVPVPGAITVSSVAMGPDGLLWGVAGKTVFAVDAAERQGGQVLTSSGRRASSGDIVATGDAVYVSIDLNKIYRIAPGKASDAVRRAGPPAARRPGRPPTAAHLAAPSCSELISAVDSRNSTQLLSVLTVIRFHNFPALTSGHPGGAMNSTVRRIAAPLTALVLAAALSSCGRGRRLGHLDGARRPSRSGCIR